MRKSEFDWNIGELGLKLFKQPVLGVSVSPGELLKISVLLAIAERLEALVTISKDAYWGPENTHNEGP